MKKDGLTDHQRHALAEAVARAYWNGWKGSLRTKDRPRLMGRQNVVVSVTTRAALYRLRMIDNNRLLTKAGVEVGEALLKHRYNGEAAAQFIGDQLTERALKKQHRAEEVADLARPFKGIRVKNRMGKKVSMAILIQENFEHGMPYIELHEGDLKELAAALC